jgi:hypothetical protein
MSIIFQFVDENNQPIDSLNSILLDTKKIREILSLSEFSTFSIGVGDDAAYYELIKKQTIDNPTVIKRVQSNLTGSAEKREPKADFILEFVVKPQ